MDKKLDIEIRPLTVKDIFPLAKIISLCGISKLKNCFLNFDDTKDYRAAGINITLGIITLICENINNCKEELLIFISDLINIDKEQIENMPPAKFIGILKSIINKEDFRDFFSALSELL